jgi:hypothetical protein
LSKGYTGGGKAPLRHELCEFLGVGGEHQREGGGGQRCPDRPA